jgi:hypothetical protein
MFELFVNSCHLHEKDDLENTNNVILPHSLLNDIKLNNYLFFRIINSELGIETFTSVQEFTAPENIIIMPFWLMEYIGVQEMSVVRIDQIMEINNGKFIRLEPQEKQFFSIPDNDKFLEASLSKFSLLHKNLIFRCDICGIPMSFLVSDVEPEINDDSPKNDDGLFNDVIIITNRDINLDIVNKFPSTPIPKEITSPKKPKQTVIPINDEFTPFSGSGQVLGGTQQVFNREEWLKRLEGK